MQRDTAAGNSSTNYVYDFGGKNLIDQNIGSSLNPSVLKYKSELLRASHQPIDITPSARIGFSEMHGKEVGLVGGPFGKMTCRYATTAIMEKTPCLEKKYAK
jgi:hypothetical protein